MKKEVCLNFLNYFCNTPKLQKKFLDFENNKDIFFKFSKEKYHDIFINYYASLLEDEIYYIVSCDDKDEKNNMYLKFMSNLLFFYNNMILSYSNNLSYYYNNELINSLISIISSNNNLSEYAIKVKDELYEIINVRISHMKNNLINKYKEYSNKDLSYEELLEFSKIYISNFDDNNYSNKLINTIIEKNYKIDNFTYIEIFKGFIKNEIKKRNLNIPVDIEFIYEDKELTYIPKELLNGKINTIKFNLNKLNSDSIITNMLDFYHKLVHLLRNDGYLSKDEVYSLYIKKEEFLIEDYENYYNDNYLDLFCETEARNKSYIYLLDYFKNNIPSKLDNIKELIKLNTFNNNQYIRNINGNIMTFDKAFDDYVKINFEEMLSSSLSDEQFKNYFIHTYDCFGNRMSINMMKILNNNLGVNEKTSKYELFKYLINLRNINDNYYKDKLNDFFTQNTRMYLYYFINNILFKNKSKTYSNIKKLK
jgi:hypothetical protein